MHRRRFAAVVVAAAMSVSLAGCWNGYAAQTTKQQEGGNSTNADVGNVQIRGLQWVRDAAAPANLYLSGTFVSAQSSGPDKLVAISAEPTGSVTGALPADFDASKPAKFGGADGKVATLTGASTAPASASSFINTTLTFEKAGVTTVQVLVVPGVGVYASVAPAGAPSASASASSAPASPVASAPAATPAG